MPIINPMYLYLIEVLHNLDVINNIILVVLAAMVFVVGAAYKSVVFSGGAAYIFEERTREELNQHKGKIIALFVVFVTSVMIAVLVPTKDAMYKMLIASYVTTDNIQLVNDAIKTNLQDYLNMLGETVKNIR